MTIAEQQAIYPDALVAAVAIEMAQVLVAADALERKPDTASSKKLATIDQELRAKLLVACNMALKRALERAGAKIVSKSRVASAAPIRERIGGVPVWRVPSVVGVLALRAALGLNEQDLLDTEFVELRKQWHDWVATAQDAALATVARVLRQPKHVLYGKAATRLEQDRNDGWNWLHGAMQERASDLFASADGGATLDENKLVLPGMVRAAIAVAGGYLSNPESSGIGSDWRPADDLQPFGGIGSGDIMLSLLEDGGASIQGYQWEHGLSDRPLEAHLNVDGVQFTDWEDDQLQNDYDFPPTAYLYPGDHDGCSCNANVILLAPEDVPDAGDATDATAPEDMPDDALAASFNPDQERGADGKFVPEGGDDKAAGTATAAETKGKGGSGGVKSVKYGGEGGKIGNIPDRPGMPSHAEFAKEYEALLKQGVPGGYKAIYGVLGAKYGIPKAEVKNRFRAGREELYNGKTKDPAAPIEGPKLSSGPRPHEEAVRATAAISKVSKLSGPLLSGLNGDVYDKAGQAKALVGNDLARATAGKYSLEDAAALFRTAGGSYQTSTLSQVLEAHARGDAVSIRPGYENSIQMAHDNAPDAVSSRSPEGEKLIRGAIASSIVKSWAISSNDDSVLSLMQQEVVEKEFGLKQTYNWTKSTSETKNSVAKMMGSSAAYRVMSAHVHAQYEATQQFLRDNKIKEVVLQRGMYGTGHVGTGTVQLPSLRPLSSFSTSGTEAKKFGSHIISAVVPAGRIYSTPRTGVGCLNEREVVVLAGPGTAHARWGH